VILLLDNYDSFTYILNDYLLQIGLSTEVYRNDEISIGQIECNNYEAVVLSPGPNTPAQSGVMMDLLKTCHGTKPILGVCLGHQAIGEFFGAKLVKAKQPMHGKTSWIKHNAHPLFNCIPSSFKAMRYHSLILEPNLPVELTAIANTAENEVMAIAHQSLPIMGLQFHPESVLTKDGIMILKNWKEMNKL
jgi:anthranilate synthase/aminodeoxychorismate synthase-like glutamine amidotransferase